MIVELNEKEFEVLKKVLGEAYDAVTDRKNIKDRKQEVNSYYDKLTERLKLALAEEGIEAKLYDSHYALKIGNYTVYCFLKNIDYDTVGVYDYEKSKGPESGELAYLKEMENDVILKIYDRTTDMFDEKAKKVFDVRNTPGMVKWIIDNIEE